MSQLLTELTVRDVAILSSLDQYRYLDTEQLRLLYYQGQRRCEARLKWLTDIGLLIRLETTVPPGWRRSDCVYVLSTLGARTLARWREEDPRPLIAKSEHARTHRAHVVHDLEANGFFVQLAVAGRHETDEGLQAWVGEDNCRRTYRARGADLTPDGWGRYLVGGRQVVMFLEWDRATESPQRIRTKTAAYVHHFLSRRQSEGNNILFVTPRRAREISVAEAIRKALPVDERPCCRFFITSVDLLHEHGCLGPVWLAIGTDPAERLRIRDLPTLPQTAFDVTECIGKERWWERRLGGGWVA